MYCFNATHVKQTFQQERTSHMFATPSPPCGTEVNVPSVIQNSKNESPEPKCFADSIWGVGGGGEGGGGGESK